jgi:peptidoglycan/xylan/chitin deacetylase (PgdA/CDA1 family)
MGWTVARHGLFVISLDFELYWGLHDRIPLDRYRNALLGVRQAVPALLRLFDDYGIHATWAVVGCLFFRTRDALMCGLPELRPDYRHPQLSAYEHLDAVGADEERDPYHFAGSLVDLIRRQPDQEIATHTFSHYYCLEGGQDAAAFKADLEAAIAAAAECGVSLETIVFPRNQVADSYLGTLLELGIGAYRGCPRSWLWRPTAGGETSHLRRAARLLDTYLPISRATVHPLAAGANGRPLNIPASRFLRPYSPRLRALEPLRARRIMGELTAAARMPGLYHLWWHPHNFGIHLSANMSFLRRLLDHYSRLRERYGMESVTMAEACLRLSEGSAGD